MAGSTGFEPAISSVTGRRDNHFTTSPSVAISKIDNSKHSSDRGKNQTIEFCINLFFDEGVGFFFLFEWIKVAINIAKV